MSKYICRDCIYYRGDDEGFCYQNEAVTYGSCEACEYFCEEEE